MGPYCVIVPLHNLTPSVPASLKLPVVIAVMEALAADIRFEGFKPARISEAREAIGQPMGDATGEINVKEYLRARSALAGPKVPCAAG